MSANNGVIRIGRKGVKKFAFGDEDEPFEVDVVAAFQQWIIVDDQFRLEEGTDGSDRSIPIAVLPEYHRAAVEFVHHLMIDGTKSAKRMTEIEAAGIKIAEVTTAEALEFIARLREQYDELADFFQPRLREERDSPGTSGEGSRLRFQVEGS